MNNDKIYYFYMILNSNLRDFDIQLKSGLNTVPGGFAVYMKEDVMSQPIIPLDPVIAKVKIDKSTKGLELENYVSYFLTNIGEITEYHKFSNSDTIKWIMSEGINIHSANCGFEKYIASSAFDKFIFPEIIIPITEDIVMSTIKYQKHDAFELILKKERDIVQKDKLKYFYTAVEYRNRFAMQKLMDEWGFKFIVDVNKLNDMKITNSNIIKLLNDNGINIELYDRKEA